MGLFDGMKDKVNGINEKRKEVERQSNLRATLLAAKTLEDAFVTAYYVPADQPGDGFISVYTLINGKQELIERLKESEYISDIDEGLDLGSKYQSLVVNLTAEGDSLARNLEMLDEPLFGPEERLDQMLADLDTVLTSYLDELISHPGVAYVCPLEDDPDHSMAIFILEDAVEIEYPTDLIMAPFLIDVSMTQVSTEDLLEVKTIFGPLVDSVIDSSPGIYEREDEAERLEFFTRLDNHRMDG
ncbi:hypothetical protein [Haloarcula nitratireducens]|uniref:SseB protein N-terminal domain-containing protein n=1 Tax=Haloarcula nitratireducens TaxID=2487749 RepID=A0AAW4PHG5_9EURY|nr:hypothetical protein [Halomicroarcula nitratireducens]MBX0296652.1 hypothetical protein [Halomicroarcula nitratireducens]